MRRDGERWEKLGQEFLPIRKLGKDWSKLEKKNPPRGGGLRIGTESSSDVGSTFFGIGI